MHVTQSKDEPGSEEGNTESSLYRVTPSGLEAVLNFQSSWSGGEEEKSDRCKLQPVTPAKAMPRLVLDCEVSQSDFHNDNPDRRGVKRKTRTERYVWKYEKR